MAGIRKTGSKPQAGGSTTLTSAERQPESGGTAKATCKASKDLTVVNGGDGKFSLSIGGKRKIDESES